MDRTPALAHYVLSKADARSGLRPGMRMAVRFDESRLHVFDPHSGVNWVRRPESPAAPLAGRKP